MAVHEAIFVLLCQ